MNTLSRRNLGRCTLALAVVSAGGVVQAQQPTSGAVLEEVIVTAQRRAEAAQDVPITITTIDSQLLEDANILQLSDIAKLTPALRFDYNSAFTQPTIRGVGNAVVTSGSTSNVGIYVDGFYIPNPLAVDFQLMGLESIQVLKGPQGTLFGRNTTGGAIVVTSARPSMESRGTIEASYGNYNSQRYGFYGTTGLTDNVAVDAEAFFESGDGYWDNIVTGNDDDAEYDNWTGRLGLAVDFSEDADLLFRYFHHDVDDGRPTAYNTGKVDGEFIAASGVPDSLKTADPGKLASQLPLGFTNETDGYQLTLRFDLGFADLTSYTQYREDDSRMVQDNDGTGATVTQIEIVVKDETLTQEFLLTSNSDGRLQWTAGMFYMDYKDTFFPVNFIIPAYGFLDWTTGAGSTSTTKALAGYLDLTYQLTDRLFLTAGARYSKDKVEDASIWVGGPFAPVENYDDDQVTPRVVLRYELGDNSSVYGSYTQGYKAGFLDVANPPPAEIVDPEEIDAYEIGYKYAGDRLGFDLAAFYYDYKNLQVSIYPEGTAITVNAASAEITGAEGQLRYAVTPQFQVSAGLAWVDAEYQDFPSSFQFIEVGGLFAPVPFDSSGLRMQRSPEWTGTLTARYETDVAGGLLALSGNLYYSSDFYFDAAEYLEEDSFTTLGLRAAWTSPSELFTLAVYGDNVTDEEYRVQAQQTFSGLATIWAPPVTYGVSVKFNF